MKGLLLISVLVVICLTTCLARDLVVGTIYNTKLIHREKAEYYRIPFKKRVKNVFFNNANNTLIKGILARDLERTDGSAIVTAGGVGFSYANVRLKSERGLGLNYQIEFYG